jgi:hypothetical protein
VDKPSQFLKEKSKYKGVRATNLNSVLADTDPAETYDQIVSLTTSPHRGYKEKVAFAYDDTQLQDTQREMNHGH